MFVCSDPKERDNLCEVRGKVKSFRMAKDMRRDLGDGPATSLGSKIEPHPPKRLEGKGLPSPRRQC